MPINDKDAGSGALGVLSDSRSVRRGGGYLLSHFRSIIGVARFNFSVRNGKRWSPCAIATLVSFFRSVPVAFAVSVLFVSVLLYPALAVVLPAVRLSGPRCMSKRGWVLGVVELFGRTVVSRHRSFFRCDFRSFSLRPDRRGFVSCPFSFFRGLSPGKGLGD